ncbi:hypothetical protein LINGRAHAP2_LOCUS18905 [Linum grandiflorum]
MKNEGERWLSKLIFSKLILGDELDRVKVGDRLGWPRRDLDSFGIPAGVRTQLAKSTIVCKFKDQGWLLLHHYGHSFYDDNHRLILTSYSDSGSSCCFNPNLPWPACFVRLPALGIQQPDFPVAAAFSASLNDSARDLKMLVFHSGDTFSAIRICPGREEQEKYFISDGTRRVPLAATYMETTEGGKFFVLFESGDILVWATEKVGGFRTILVAKSPQPSLSVANYRNTDQLLFRAVGESLVMIWSQSSSSSFRLVSAEETHNNHHRELEEGRRGGGGITTYFVGEDANVKIRKDNRSFHKAIMSLVFYIPELVLIVIPVYWIIGVCFSQG